MGIPKNLMKRIDLAIKKIEESKLKNNYFVFWAGNEPKDIPPKSLAIKLTKYNP